eukprot:1157788-Pelagomonas_calceolata.AAC.11
MPCAHVFGCANRESHHAASASPCPIPIPLLQKKTHHRSFPIVILLRNHLQTTFCTRHAALESTALPQTPNLPVYNNVPLQASRIPTKSELWPAASRQRGSSVRIDRHNLWSCCSCCSALSAGGLLSAQQSRLLPCLVALCEGDLWGNIVEGIRASENGVQIWQDIVLQ